MAMSYIWSGLVILSFLWGFFHGNLSAVAAAALDGAQSALELSLSMAGILCLWSGVMEILNVCGLSRRIAALFRPLLRRLLPNASRDEETLADALLHLRWWNWPREKLARNIDAIQAGQLEELR